MPSKLVELILKESKEGKLKSFPISNSLLSKNIASYALSVDKDALNKKTEHLKLQVLGHKYVDALLRKHKWFVSPSMPETFVWNILRLKKRKNLTWAISQLYILFFTRKRCVQLSLMVESWNENPLFKKRMPILKDCVQVFRKMQKGKINVSNVLLPTLFAQIDGLISDLLVSKSINWKANYVSRGKNKDGRIDVFINRKFAIRNICRDDTANELILKYFFQSSDFGKPLAKPFVFNRHKVMHGESLTYGRLENVIRAFLILDLLANIEGEGAKDKSEIDDEFLKILG